jgi:hypothetical protein
VGGGGAGAGTGGSPSSSSGGAPAAGGGAGTPAGGANGGAAGGAAGATGTGGAPVDAGAGTGGGAGAGDGGVIVPSAAFKGVALLESTASCADIATLGLTWYYNWTTRSSCRTTAEFVPQIWGHMNEAIGTEITAIVGAGRKVILGFNEPDTASQSNMSVAAAIALWPQLEQAGLRLGSPATSANANGQAWFQQFMTMAAAQNLRIDFVAVHWYGWNAGSCNNASALESYVKWAEQWGKPIWITEWGCLNVSGPTAATVQGFYDSAIVMFQKHPLIERYGWFLSRATDTNALVNTTTVTLTPLGTDYAAAPGTH